jgi:hypothetical protein
MRESHSSEFGRYRWVWDGVTFIGCLGVLAVLCLPWLAWPDWRRTWYVRQGALTTLLQVVPATVVAVFIFAVGAVLVMVQIIGPTLGSRAIEDLLARRRARICVIAGMVLLLACLALAALALIKEKHLPEQWEASAASALALATLIYVPFSIWCISSVFHGFVSPRCYSTLLSRRRGLGGLPAAKLAVRRLRGLGRLPAAKLAVRRLRGLGRLPAAKLAVRPLRKLWQPPLTSDLAFHRLRALRQWLRTACRTGESRDIVFALRGFQELAGYYCDEAREEQRLDDERLKEDKPPGENLRSKPPAEYSHSDEIVNSRWRVLLDPSHVPPDKMSQLGWFGAEFGRALARSAEVGIRSGLLLRDLDRLLLVLGGATLRLAGFRPPERGCIGPAEDRPLPEEAGFLLDRIAEIGMYALQIQDKAYSDWFVRPALVLARLERELEGVNAKATGLPLLESSPANGNNAHRQEHTLAGRSLAAWCLVNYALQQYTDGASVPSMPATHGQQRLGERARNNPELWEEAKELAMTPAIHPSWMPLVHDESDDQQRLSTFLITVQAQVACQRPSGNPVGRSCFLALPRIL